MAYFSFDLREIGRDLHGSLVVVLPIYNEEANIAAVIGQWMECLRDLGIPFQIIALDDGSRDRTLEILLGLELANSANLCVVSKPNSGHGITCRIGYDIAAHSSAKWILQIDSDGQCDPKYFADFWNQREAHDCVFGLRKSRDDGTSRIFTSMVCRVAASLICGRDLRDPNVPYRLMRGRVLEQALGKIPPNFNIHNVALTYVLKRQCALRWAYVPIHFPDRQGGTNSVGILKVVTWGTEMLLELLRLRLSSSRA